MINIDNVSIPKDWTAEKITNKPYMVALGRPLSIGGGYVTIDFEKRIFGPGFGGTPNNDFINQQEVDYRGRCWKKAIVSDAVAWLESVSSC